MFGKNFLKKSNLQKSFIYDSLKLLESVFGVGAEKTPGIAILCLSELCSEYIQGERE